MAEAPSAISALEAERPAKRQDVKEPSHDGRQEADDDRALGPRLSA